LDQIIGLNSFLAAKMFVPGQEKGQRSGRSQWVRPEPALSSSIRAVAESAITAQHHKAL